MLLKSTLKTIGYSHGSLDGAKVEIDTWKERCCE